MQTLPFQFYAVQFFSRSCSPGDVVTTAARLTTDAGLTLEGRLTIQFGAPLLDGPGDIQARPRYAPPERYQERAANSVDELQDPYAEIRWPEYALARFFLDDPERAFASLEVTVQCDLLKALHTLVSKQVTDMFQNQPAADQFLPNKAYRFSYWTPVLDSAGNPLPVAAGDYIHALTREPIGPGFAALRGTGRTDAGPESCSLALVWSQSFTGPSATDAGEEAIQIAKRAHELQQRFSAKEDLKRADECLLKGDVRGCITAAQIAVESAVRFYCNLWGVRFPSLPGIDYHQRIERLLKRAGRASYQVVDPATARALEHLYRASLKAHEGDCYYRDDQLRRNVSCDRSHAGEFLDAAIRFTFWLDAQA